ncbi:DMT family transporter [Vallitalea okinawensis]|uniref:DMT family transporter n=1 Tax=Vallitalea okinawensis TaxID=2078660 RepID=UPI000CFD7D0D|nr:DMT family transporter [Vallitalea okinawensis]
MKKGVLADTSLMVVAVIWGSGFIGSKMALDASYHPFAVMFLRFLIATIIIGIVFYKKLNKENFKQSLPGIIAGIFLFLGFATQTVGLLYTTPSNNAFLTATNVILVPFIGYLIFKTKPRRASLIGAFVCFIGIGILTYQGDIALSSGDLLTLSCAVFFACHIVCVGYYAKKVDAYFLVFMQMLMATLLSFIALLIFEEQPFHLYKGIEGFLAVFYLGVFSTCVAFFVQNIAQQYTSATKTAIFLSMESVFGTLFSVMLGFEPATINMVFGGILIIAAILITEIKPSLKSKKEEVRTEEVMEE